MKKLNIKAIAATSVATVALLLSMSACKGRTLDNVQPTGDTVEVEIEEVSATDSSVTVTSEAGVVTLPDSI